MDSNLLIRNLAEIYSFNIKHFTVLFDQFLLSKVRQNNYVFQPRLAAQSISFTKPVYDFTITHGIRKNKNELGYVKITGAHSDGEIRYTVDNQLSPTVRVSVDHKTGRVRLLNSVPPISFEVVVHAETGSKSVKEEATAIVRVHVTCHFLFDL